MDIVSFGFTAAPKNNMTKVAEKTESPRIAHVKEEKAGMEAGKGAL
jgi:hypothetical protein